MARQRWGTFSVADHLDLRALVPDVLLFDCLAFPFPPNTKEWDYWVKNDWDPALLQYVLGELDDLALSFDWGDEQRHEFQTNMRRAEVLEELPVSWKKLYPKDAQIPIWEMSKSATRYMIGNYVKQRRGTDFLVMPCYRSCDAFLADQKAKMRPASRESRRDALALLVGQKMTIPHDADPKEALRLAIKLARDPDFQRRREDLFNWQEDVVGRNQTSEDDARALRHLIADLNAFVAKTHAKRRDQWMFFALKQAVGLMENVFTGIAGAAIEGVEIIRDGEEAPPGPMAVFHHVRERVIKASFLRKPAWKFW